MEVEKIEISEKVSHTVIPIEADGACLFRALSYLLFDTQECALKVREQIVSYVETHWEDFGFMTDDGEGNNYTNSTEYRNNMSQPSTCGGVSELKAAGELFQRVFEVYCDGKLYQSFGVEGNPVGRLCFTGLVSGGHFDVYVP